MTTTTNSPLQISLDQPGMIALRDETPLAAAGIARHIVLDSGKTRVLLLTLPAGKGLPEHATPGRALIQILNGQCEFTFGEKKVPLRAGDLLHIPPGLPHSVSAKKHFSMLLTQSFEAEGVTSSSAPF